MRELPLARFRRSGELGQRLAVVRGARRWTRGAVRFGANELFTGATATYRLRRGRLELMVRHAGSDSWVFGEVFVDGLYDSALALVDGVEAPKIVDLGAHVGMFSVRAAASVPAARIVAVEPDRENLALLREVFERNARRGLGSWTLVEGAAAARPGTVSLVQDASYVSHVDSVGHPPPGFEARAERRLVEVPAHDVFALVEGADLMKMDVEGSEWAILADPRLGGAGVRHLFLEYHAWACPRGDARRYAIELVEAAGFSVVEAPPAGEHQGVLVASRRA